jgi:GTP cyclohydrolase I
MLQDVQNEFDNREIAVEQVGVSELRYPVTVLDRTEAEQHTIADITLSIGLPHDTKGADLSQFIEVLEQYRGELTIRTIPDLLLDVKKKLDAESARIEIHFSYFLERRAPASDTPALMDYGCSFVGEANGSTADFVLGVSVPVTSLCPSSKTISEHGARNQRALLKIQTRSDEIVWIEELIEIAESSASAPIYPLLKRADERHVTMQAYDNPVSVEDMVRNVAVQLRDDVRINWFRVRADNHESIHNHNAFAQVTWAREG